jgi:hypothetical protein
MVTAEVIELALGETRIFQLHTGEFVAVMAVEERSDPGSSPRGDSNPAKGPDGPASGGTRSSWVFRSAEPGGGGKTMVTVGDPGGGEEDADDIVARLLRGEQTSRADLDHFRVAYEPTPGGKTAIPGFRFASAAFYEAVVDGRSVEVDLPFDV